MYNFKLDKGSQSLTFCGVSRHQEPEINPHYSQHPEKKASVSVLRRNYTNIALLVSCNTCKLAPSREECSRMYIYLCRVYFIEL